MKKPYQLHVGDRVGIVSLSAGTLGENYARHQQRLGCQRLREFGLEPVFMDNALRGVDYLHDNPQARAEDLQQAFSDDSIKGIIAAIGGNDTYRLLPYLMENPQFAQDVQKHPKLFTGFSDTTTNHLMFYQLGLQTFYGPNFLNDLAELDEQMLPYTYQTFKHYLTNPSQTPLDSSPVWYEERTDFSEAAVGTSRRSHAENNGYKVLRGSGEVEGRLLGGCLESMFKLLETDSQAYKITQKYQIFPSANQWQGKILFIETSEEKPTPDVYRQMLRALAKNVFPQICAIIVGKPQNQVYFDEYQSVLVEETAAWDIPILYNVNFGHAYPRTALPYNAKLKIDFDQATLLIDEPYFAAK